MAAQRSEDPTDAGPVKTESGTYPITRRSWGPQGDEQADDLFADDATARHHLARLRWPAGFHCPLCDANAPAHVDRRGMVSCGACDATVSPALGTPFEAGPVPLRQWLLGMWTVFARERGADEAVLAARLGVDEDCAWSFVRALGRLLRRRRGELLRGVVEVLRAPVEVAVGHGGRTRVVTVAILAEVRGDTISRVIATRLRDRDDGDCLDLVREVVRPGSCVRTGPWRGYESLRREGFGHLVTVDEDRDELLHHARQVASLLRLWLWASRPVQLGRLDPYLDEFAFRFDANLRFPAHDRGARFEAAVRLGWQLRPVSGLRAVG